MTRIRNEIAAGVVVALCLALAGCSSSVGGKPTDSQLQTDLEATAAGADEKQHEAPADGRSDAVADHATEKKDDEAVRLATAYVTADRLNVRLAPSLDAEITNVLLRGQKVDVLEVQGGWSRITRYDDEFAAGDSGKVARWVASAYLSDTRSDDDTVPVGPASPLVRAIGRSDDSHVYRSSFLTAARQLIERGQCTVADFEEIGGWVRSAGRRSVYFTYCGGRYPSNRIYLEVDSGRIFRQGSLPAALQN